MTPTPTTRASLLFRLRDPQDHEAWMEQLAGGEQWQQEAAALLTTDELDAAVPEPMVWSEVDFSVEHLEPSEDANLLGQLGGYDVLAIIGRGGMGVVLKAFDRELKRPEEAATSLFHACIGQSPNDYVMGGSQGLVLIDAQKQWLDEREQLGELQIASNEFRMILESYWTIESHPGSKLIEGTDLRKIFDFNLPGKSPSCASEKKPETFQPRR